MGLWERVKNRVRYGKEIEEAQEAEEKSELEEIVSTGDELLDLCEKVLGNARELEDGKKEYHIITSYLNDIEIIENMAPDQTEEIQKAAESVAKLNNERDSFLNTSKKLSDRQFRMMQLQEDEIPDAAKLLHENETYQATVKRDMQYLEGEKREWEIEKRSCIRKRKRLRTSSYLLLFAAATISVLLLVLSYGLQIDTQYAWIALIVGVLLGAGFIVFRLEQGKRELRQAEVNINYAITLLNKVKIKYVNITNAVDYMREKYNVRDARELAYQWEMYQEAVLKQQRYLKTNEDLNFYYDKLMGLLRKCRLYDTRVWLDQPQALVEPKEMVEIKHNLIVRRQKLRAKIAANLDVVKKERKEIDKMMKKKSEVDPRAAEMIESIDRMAELSA